MSSAATYVDLIQNATSTNNLAVILQRSLNDPVIFFYGRIASAVRTAPCVQQHADQEGGGSSSSSTLHALLEVVELLAFDTVGAAINLLSQTAQRFVDSTVLSKLRQLTVLTTLKMFFTSASSSSLTSSSSSAIKGGDLVPYTVLAADLGIDLEAPSGLRQLEDVLLDALSNGLVGGKLDRKVQHLWVRYRQFEARDVRDLQSEAAELQAVIAQWITRCDAVEHRVQDQLKQVRDAEFESVSRAQNLKYRQDVAAHAAKDIALAQEREEAVRVSGANDRDRHMMSGGGAGFMDIMGGLLRGGSGAGGMMMGGGGRMEQRRVFAATGSKRRDT